MSWHRCLQLMVLILVLAPAAFAQQTDDIQSLYEAGDYRGVRQAYEDSALDPSTPAPTGDDAYYYALSRFASQDYRGLREVLDDGELTAAMSEAQREDLTFKIAEAYYSERDFVNATAQFDAFADQYPRSEQAKAARFQAMESVMRGSEILGWDLSIAYKNNNMESYQAMLAERARRLGNLTTSGSLRIAAGQIDAEDVRPLERMIWSARILRGELVQLQQESESWPAEKQADLEYETAYTYYRYDPWHYYASTQMFLQFVEDHPGSPHAADALYFAAMVSYNEAMEAFKEARVVLRENTGHPYGYRRWSEGREHLRSFLAIGKDLIQSNQASLDASNRSTLIDQLGQAAAYLDEPTEDIPISGADRDERLAASKTAIAYDTYRPAEDWEATRQLMLQFIADYPDSPERPLVEWRAAMILFDHALDRFYRVTEISGGKDTPESAPVRAEAEETIAAFRVEAERVLDEYGLELPLDERDKLQRSLWETRFILGEGEALLAETLAEQGEIPFDLKFQQLQSLYHTHQWEAYWAAADAVRMAPDTPPRYASDLTQRMLWSFGYARDMDRMEAFCNELLADAEKGTFEWAQARTHWAIAQVRPDVTELDDAAAALDEVLATTFPDNEERHPLTSVTAYWRLHIAQRQGDTQKLNEVIDRLEAQSVDNFMRSAALTQFAPAQ